MNPLQWRSEHQVALLLGVVVGIALGFVTGYMHNNIHFTDTVSFSSYLTGGGALRWGVFGALVGGMSCSRFRRHRVRCFMEQEVCHGEKAVYTGVQA
jgi:hypothetical protein